MGNNQYVILETTVQNPNGTKVPAYITDEKCEEGHVLNLYEGKMGDKSKHLGELTYLVTEPKNLPLEGYHRANTRVLYIKKLLKKPQAIDYKGIGTTLLKAALKMSGEYKVYGEIMLVAHNIDNSIDKRHPVDFYSRNGFSICNKNDKGNQESENPYITMQLKSEGAEDLARSIDGDIWHV